MKTILKHIFPIAGVAMLSLAVLPSCEDGKSYSDLLRDEEKAVNWYMADQKIALEIPTDSVFITGPDAPYYKMDEQGYLYMQVIDPGNLSDRPKKGDKVYFRYMSKNLNYLYQGMDHDWIGNGDNLGKDNTSFIFEEALMVNSIKFGQGIQWPLKYLGYNSEVNLVIRSYYGFQENQSQCLAFIYRVKYYRPEY